MNAALSAAVGCSIVFALSDAVLVNGKTGVIVILSARRQALE